MLARLLERLRGAGSTAPEEFDPVRYAAAALFLEVAWADHEVSDAEVATARTGLEATLGLSRSEAEELVDSTRAGLDSHVGLQAFTRALVEAWPQEKRYELVVQLWRLALSDARIDKYEEATIRRIADLLYIGHGQFIEAKRTARRTFAQGG